MWFIGGEGTLKPDTKQKDDADLYEWERRQLRKGRLHSMHFQVEVRGGCLCVCWLSKQTDMYEVA